VESLGVSMKGSGMRNRGSVGKIRTQVTRYSLWPCTAFLVKASLVARKKAETTVSGNQSGMVRMIAEKGGLAAVGDFLMGENDAAELTAGEKTA
jgi:hypothetical protein